MILDFLKDNLNGDTWEDWCVECYRDRYQNEHFIKVPATHQGDVGIEGYTLSGVAFQCYCPEKSYTDDQLYNHLRDKVSADIAKLIDSDNAARFKELGLPVIREWHFVTPDYKDKRIIQHLEKKRLEVLEIALQDQEKYYYISPEIKLIPKIANDFSVEFVRLIRNPLIDIKLNAAIKKTGKIDWSNCSTEKIDNIKRKLKAIMNVEEDDEDFSEMLGIWAQAYLDGLDIMSKLQESYGTIYEDLFELEQQYKKDVSIKTKMNPDHSMNYKIFNEILDKFETTLREQFKYFSEPTILELRTDIVGGWLADCSLQFKKS